MGKCIVSISNIVSSQWRDFRENSYLKYHSHYIKVCLVSSQTNCTYGYHTRRTEYVLSYISEPSGVDFHENSYLQEDRHYVKISQVSSRTNCNNGYFPRRTKYVFASISAPNRGIFVKIHIYKMTEHFDVM
jgi:hypothetical protein